MTGIIFSVILCMGWLSNIAALDVKGFDDSVLYQINWLGQMSWNQLESLRSQSPEIKTVMGNPLEVYECAMPVAIKESASDSDYNGPTPFELVSTLFSASLCSYRIESYWTYEICHGHYIKQYHEEREGKVSKLQEFYLGKWNKKKTAAILEMQTLNNGTNATPTEYKRVQTSNVPYVEVEMSDGTICDLTNKPRMTRVLYVCHTNGKNDVFSLKETSSCNYEIIILTSVLCTHPKYKPGDMVVNVINCGAVYSFTPRKPRSLMAMELESMKLQYQKLPDMMDNLKDIAVVNFKDGTLKMEILQADQLRSILNERQLLVDEIEDDKRPVAKPPTPPIKLSTTIDDTSPVTAFLLGKICLTGGTGWWKYEFCYGRHVRQFHADKNNEQSLFLGFFNEAQHKEWIGKNEMKRPNKASGKPHLTHFYSDGTLCEKTGEKRQTEVKLKCMEKASSPAAVALYLMEPKTCQYILGVESPLICDIIPKADDDGLISLPAYIQNREDHEHMQQAEETNNNNDNSNGKDDLFLGNAVVEDFEVRFEND